MQDASNKELKSVRRVSAILLAFLETEEWSMSALARHIGVHKSVVHRVVGTLSASGLLIRDSRSGRYRLGPVMAHLGERAERNGTLHRLARPHLEQLAKQSGETASLQVIQGDHGLCVDVVESAQAMRFTISPGQTFPLHAGCAGKILLAYRSSVFIDRLLKNRPLQRYTDATLVDPERLRTELESIRKAGFGTSEGEITPGARSIGVPVLGPNGDVFASLVISGPSTRLTETRMEEQREGLLAASASLSRLLGSMQSEVEGDANAA